MSYKTLLAYQKAFALAMKIFNVTKRFPKEELFGLTGQIRRSSPSVCSNMAEGYRKRRYEAHFVSKLTDADTENSETEVWLDFSLACEYITEEEYNALYADAEEVGRMLAYMIEHPSKFLSQADKNLKTKK
ncbi:four helix bundle protein [Flavisolibacter sp. BT320]|nr:four helix bundle protein [Flavisolibacter longurius]